MKTNSGELSGGEMSCIYIYIFFRGDAFAVSLRDDPQNDPVSPASPPGPYRPEGPGSRAGSRVGSRVPGSILSYIQYMSQCPALDTERYTVILNMLNN